MKVRRENEELRSVVCRGLDLLSPEVITNVALSFGYFFNKRERISRSKIFFASSPDFKFDGRKVLIYLEAANKPNLAPGPTWNAELDAVWNLDTGKFEKADLHGEDIGFRKPDE